MMASLPSLNFNRSYKLGFESELIAILKIQYVCYRPNTLICLGDNDMRGFPNVVLRRSSCLGNTECLADMKNKIRILIDENDAIVNVRDCMGLAPLHLVCSLHSPGQLTILEILCSQGASNPNCLDSSSRTPLHHALSPGNIKYHSECDDSGESLVDIVTLLIKHGANVNAKDCQGVTPLHLALDFYRSGFPSQLQELKELVSTLVNAGASLDLKAPSAYIESSLTPLHLACLLNGRVSLDVMSLLISPEHINSTDHLMKTPLHKSLLDEQSNSSSLQPSQFTEEKVQLLLDHGADVNAKDDEGMTPLLIVLKNYPYCVPLVKLLLEHYADPCVRVPHKGVTPLHLACKHLDKELIELVPLFLKGGARINARDNKLRTPFHCALLRRGLPSKASRYASITTLRALVKFGANPTLNDVQQNSSIHMVCVSPHHHLKEVITFLICAGCDMGHVNTHGNTPLLHFLLANYDRKSIQTLIDLGADCRVRNIEGISPLHLVSRSIEYHDDVGEIVEVMLKGGADVNAQDCNGNTPLHYAVRDLSTTNMKAIRKLLLAGANSNIVNSTGISPLHIVCRNGGYYLAKMLLNFGADVNIKDGDSNTPLHIAQASHENAAIISRVLVENGADLSAKNNCNVNPFTIMSLKTYNFMIGHTVLLIVSGKYRLNEKEVELIDHNKTFRNRYTDCFSCAPAMKSQFIGKSSVTLLEFLLARNERASRYIRNHDILNNLTSLANCPKYRCYSGIINDKLSEVVFIKTLFDRTSRSLRTVLSPIQYLDFIVEKILSFLDEDDMNAFNRAVVFS